jgi:hypothetical protein
MKINVFTIRSKADNSLIHAEGVPHNECYPHFDLDKKWLTQDDLTKRNRAWRKWNNTYSFDEELRHLFNYEYDLVKFSLEEIDYK